MMIAGERKMYLKCKYITDNQLFEYKNSKILLYLCSGSGYRTRLVIKWLLTLFLFKGGSKNYGFKFLAILMFSVSAAFRLFGVILSSLISHIARYAPSSTYKSTHEKKNENQLDIISRTTLKGERKRQAMQ